jgi:thioredoxin reductase
MKRSSSTWDWANIDPERRPAFMRHVAVIGAGPIGLEAALEARHRGFEVTLFEAGEVGEHLRLFGHMTLFTPFAMNSTPFGRERVVSSGAKSIDEDVLLKASELVERYLEPLANLPELAGRVHTRSRVTHVGREGLTKGSGAGGSGCRSGQSFLLRVDDARGRTRLERADVVIDATGVYGNPKWTGAGGLPAIGEERLGSRVDRHAPALLGPDRARFSGASVLLVGDGHSAATALLELMELARMSPAGAPQVHWVTRARGERPFVELPGDPLPARRELHLKANAVAGDARWLAHYPGWTITGYEETGSGAIRTKLSSSDGKEVALSVDRVLALVGYRPDTAITRELQVHHCYASEGPMKLAAAILASALESPERAADCLAQTAHGPESLRNPEPDFFILGAKSYGRNPAFLLTVGHRQVEDALSLIEAAEPLQSAASSSAR